jgi:hypothetical protein
MCRIGVEAPADFVETLAAEVKVVHGTAYRSLFLPGIDVFDPNPDSIPAMRGMAVGRIRRGLAPERNDGDDPSKNAGPARWSRSERRCAAPNRVALSPCLSGSCS